MYLLHMYICIHADIEEYKWCDGKRACRPEGPIQPPVDVSFTTRKENKHRIQISPQQTHDLIVQCLPIL
jgi:hypothetical protein